MKFKDDIIVVYGGKSEEHDVSIVSGAAIIGAFLQSNIHPIPILIHKNGRSATIEESLHLFPHKENREKLSAYVSQHEFWKDHSNVDLVKLLTMNKSTTANLVLFPVLHGPFGEDGRIQGFFETLNIRYVGNNVISSAIGMNKDISKRLVQHAGMPVVDWKTFHSNDWRLSAQSVIDQIKESFGYPLFIKPANLGSSVGISKVYSDDELKEGLSLAFNHDPYVLVEKSVNAREVELAVLDTKPLVVSVPGEIIPDRDYYDYDSKYDKDSKTKLVIPAELPETKIELLKFYSERIFRILNLKDLARIDFLVDKISLKIYFNEVNTMPGFTPISMYPMLMDKMGIPFPKLVETLVEMNLSPTILA